MIRSADMKWKVVSETQPDSLEKLEALLLTHRHIEDPAVFFQPIHPEKISLEDVAINPEEVDKAIQRIKTAIQAKENIVVFGDYDADGVCSTTTLWEVLHGLGAQAIPFIPHREKHGYGMTDRSLDALFEQQKPSLVITVDNGIVAHKAAQRLKENKVDLIITDHHQPEKRDDDGQEGAPYFPEALAVVHSTKLCGTTVAWMLARELSLTAVAENWNIERSELINPLRSLDLCAIATIADQMVLLRANRSFVVHGLVSLQKTERPGLMALYEAAAIDSATITATTVNYSIAPRINAMGRLDHSLEAVRLMCTKNPQRAAELAAVLGSTNSRRQELTNEMLGHAIEEAKSWKEDHIIVVASAEYHEGVIGLIAGRLVELYAKPAIAISVGESFAKASARSVAGVNIVDLIRTVRDDLLEVGGHPMAAGFGLLPEKLTLVMDRLRILAKSEITEELLEPTLEIECELPLELVTKKTAEMIEQFMPFGQGNVQPIFSFPEAELIAVQTVGKQATHLKVGLLFDGATEPVWAMGWGMAKEFGMLAAGPLARVRAAGCLELNHWNGQTKLQIILKDLEVSAH